MGSAALLIKPWRCVISDGCLGRVVAVSLLKNWWLGIILLGTAFAFSLVFAVSRYQLNGFLVWWLISAIIVYCFEKVHRNEIKINKVSNENAENEKEIGIFSILFFYCFMPFIYMIVPAVLLSTFLWIANIYDDLKYINVDDDSGSYYEDYEYYRR